MKAELNGAQPPPLFHVLGTPLRATSYAGFTAFCQQIKDEPRATSIDFTNTQIVTMRRHEPEFRALTSSVDYFIPDGMPLIWCLNFLGAQLKDRVYGPAFMRYCLLNSPAPITHYFLGGSETCVAKLRASFEKENPAIKIVGTRNGYFTDADTPAILEEINRLSPDFIWVGLGTPKQQAWIHQNKSQIKRGLILAVGFAFDVNAGTKPDAPLWMQKRGLTWVHRLCSEPGRLLPRYFRYNRLFLSYLIRDGVRGRAFTA